MTVTNWPSLGPKESVTKAELATAEGKAAGETKVEREAREAAIAAVEKGKIPVFNVKTDYGAKGDGVTNDSVAIQNAINAAAEVGGGVVYFPHGTYIAEGIQRKTGVKLLGAGRQVSILKLKAGSKTDLLTTVNFAAGGCDFGGWEHMSFDGNKEECPEGGCPIANDGRRTYAAYFEAFNGNSSNFLHRQSAADFANASGGSDSSFAFYITYNSNENGTVSKAHDTNFSVVHNVANKLSGFTNTSTGIASVIEAMHNYGAEEHAFLFEGSFDCINCDAEGASVSQVRCKSGGNWHGGRVFVAGTPENVPGFEIMENTTELKAYGVEGKNFGTAPMFLAAGASAGSGSVLEFQLTSTATTPAFGVKEGASWSGNIKITPRLRNSTKIGTQPESSKASANVISIDDVRVVKVTGNIEIKKIEPTYNGHVVTLRFSGQSGEIIIADGENLKLAGNFAAKSDSTLTLVCQEGNWYEIGRSVN